MNCSLRKTFYALIVALLISPLCSAITFVDVWEFQVEGNSLLTTDTIQRTLSPYLGSARKTTDIDEAAKSLQTLYRNNGFPTVFVSVPPQDVINGVVKIEVNEAVIRRVKVDNNKYFTISGIRSNIPTLAEGAPLHLPSLQKELQQVNMLNKNLKVVPVLKQAPTADKVDVDLDVADELPIDFGIEITNYHTELTTPRRLSVDVGYSNLWQKSHEFSVQMQTSPDNKDEVKVFATSYIMPASAEGDKFAFYTVSSDSEIATVTDLGVIGDGSVFGFRYIKPFIQRAAELHSISVGFDYKDFGEVILTNIPESKPISYASLTSQYNYFSKSGKFTNNASAGLTFGIRGGLNNRDEFGLKTSESESNFVLAKYDWKSKYDLGKQWSLTGQLRGQFTSSPLVSNEKFSTGGVGTVRGYYDAQAQGDYGWLANVELETPKYNFAPIDLQSLRAFLFYDVASVALKGALAEQEERSDIAGYGLGLKGSISDHFIVRLDAGVALKELGSVDKGDVSARGSFRLEF